MHDLLQDIRYAVRGLSRSRTFTIVAVLALAIGVGANTAIFSVVNAVLLRELPYPNPDRLVMLWEHNNSKPTLHNVVNPANFLAWQDAAKSFEAMAALYDLRATVSGVGDEPVSVPIRATSAAIFPLLGIQSALGRAYTRQVDMPGGPNVALIGYDFWKTHFHGRPGVVGASFRLAGEVYTVIGVMLDHFRFLNPADVWVPIGFGAATRAVKGRFIRVVARLKPGITMAQANTEMRLLAARRAGEAPELDTNWTANAQLLRESLVGDVRTGLLVLLGAVGFLLVIACANVANLMLARAAKRQKEFAIRASLGATPVRLMRQLLTESIVLSLFASFLGVGLALLGTRAIVALIPKEFPALSLADVAIDGRVLIFTLFVALLTGVAFGLVPALTASRGTLHDSLKQGGRSDTGGSRATGRLRGALVNAELSLAVVLLAGAGLMMRSFSELHRVQLGFEPDHVLTAQVALPAANYRSDTSQIAFFHSVEARIAALPGVRSVGAISYLPLSGERSASSFTVDGQPTPPAGQEPMGDMRAVTPGYFRAMRIPIKAGRSITAADLAGRPDVAVIGEALARTFWPHESAVGKYIDYEWGRPEHVQIVGVAGDVHDEGAGKGPFLEIYRPAAQFPYSTMTLVVRSAGDPALLATALRAAVRSVDRDQPVAKLATMNALVAESLGKSRLSMMLFGLFGAVGLVPASVGIYGVMSYGVMQRTREFGVRMALGARPSDVRDLVVLGSARLTAVGIGIGIVGALLLTRLMRSLLFSVGPTDPVTYLSSVLVLGTVALLASYLPARRATRVDPAIALRNE